MNRLGILVVSHGNLSEELLKSAEMISGVADKNQVMTVTMSADEGLDGMEKKSKAAVEQLEKHNKEIIILTDLVGGTPNNVALSLSIERENIRVIAGANLIVLLSLLTGLDNEQLDLSEVVESSKESIVLF